MRDVGTLPPEAVKLMSTIVDQAHEIYERDKKLLGAFFLIKDHQPLTVMLTPDISDPVKMIIKGLTREKSRTGEIDGVIFAGEAWMVVRTKLDDALDRPVSQEPDRKDVVIFQYESFSDGQWLGHAEVANGTFGEISWHKAPPGGTSGKLNNMLHYDKEAT
jgi:hypothetical protein